MFEKPKLISTKRGSLRILIAEKAAQELVRDLKTANFNAEVSAEDITYTDFNSGADENVATINLTGESKDAVGKFLRNRH